MDLNNEEVKSGANDFNERYNAMVKETGYFFSPAIVTGEDGITLRLVMQIFKKNIDESVQ